MPDFPARMFARDLDVVFVWRFNRVLGSEVSRHCRYPSAQGVQRATAGAIDTQIDSRRLSWRHNSAAPRAGVA